MNAGICRDQLAPSRRCSAKGVLADRQPALLGVGSGDEGKAGVRAGASRTVRGGAGGVGEKPKVTGRARAESATWERSRTLKFGWR